MTEITNPLAALKEALKDAPTTHGIDLYSRATGRHLINIKADALIAMLEQHEAIAANMAGCVMVPMEPTPDMRIAGGIAWSEALPTSGTYVDCADACYKAMLTAAQQEKE